MVLIGADQIIYALQRSDFDPILFSIFDPIVLLVVLLFGISFDRSFFVEDFNLL